MNKTVKLKTCCKKIGSGITPRGGDSVYVDNGVSLIRSQNIYNVTFSTQGLAFIDNEIARKMKGVTVENNDVLLNITGDSVARCCKVPISVLPARVNQHVSIIRAYQEKLNPAFLMYFLVSPQMQLKMLSLAGSGGTRKALTKEMIESFDIPSSGIKQQNDIVDILASYDDLIDTNRRRIQLLEESARLLFREWFVYFKFPGHEKVKIADGAPYGWKKEKLNKIVSLLGGHAFKSNSYQQEGKYGIVTIKNVQQGRFIPECTDYLEETPSGMRKHCLLSNGDILMSLTGNVGRVCLVYGENFLLNQRVAKIEPQNTIPKSFIYWMFDDSMMQKRVENLSYGSAQQNLSPIKLGEQMVILPPNLFLESFDEIVSLINIEIIQLLIQNQKLAQARDLLLPRLMSGAIKV